MRNVLMVAVVFLLSAAGCDGCLEATGRCCKVCKDSKACGDSCIPRSSTCNGLAESVIEDDL